MRVYLLLLFTTICSTFAGAQCSGLEIIGVIGDNDPGDAIYLRATADIPGGTIFYITDNEWDATSESFRDLNENEETWTAPSTGILAGSIIKLSGSTASCGSLTNTPSIGAGGEEIYILSKAPGTTNGDITSNDICFAFSSGGTGDLPTSNSVDVGNNDNAAYSGSDDITDPTNWTADDDPTAITYPVENCIDGTGGSVCTASLTSSTVTCDAFTAGTDNYTATFTYTHGSESSALTVSSDHGTPDVTTVSGNATITVSGISEGTDVTLTITGGNSCNLTATVNSPTCNASSGDGGEIVFQAINPCGNDGNNEFVVINIKEDINIDDIAIGSRSGTTDNSWNYFWNTDNSTVGVSDLNPDVTSVSSTGDFRLLDPADATDKAEIDTRIAELNAAANVDPDYNTNVFQSVPDDGNIPSGSTIILFLGSSYDGSNTSNNYQVGFDDVANNLAFTDPSYNNAEIYAIMGNGGGAGFFSNSNSREQNLYINGSISQFSYTPTSTSPFGYADASGAYTIQSDCTIPKREILEGTSVQPVSFLSFSVERKNNTNLLQWETSFESNNEKFVVQRSFDGHSFHDIGEISGQGNVTAVHEYFFEDATSTNSHSIYYRLKQIDYDGKTSFSKIIHLIVDQKTDISIYPNPLYSSETLYINGEKLNSFKVFNTMGKMVGEYHLHNSSNHRLDINRYHKGHYIIRFDSGKILKFTVL